MAGIDSIELLEQLFLDHVVFIRTTGCWAWTGPARGGKDQFRRYGGFSWNGESYYAHRLSYRLFNGPIPKGQWILHRCDIPFCVNPTHLLLGTSEENVADRVKKSRSAKGEKHGCSRLTTPQVLDIRSRHKSGETQGAIASHYGISRSVIREIVHRRAWTHI